MRHIFTTMAAICLCIFLAASSGQAQNAQTPAFNGIVSAVNGNGTFVIVDRTGAQVMLKVVPQTTIQNNKNPAVFQEVIKVGVNVKGTMTPDGVAIQISANGQPGQVRIAQMQFFLGASDEEWALLRPKIELVQALRDEVDGQNGGNNSGNNGNAPAAAPLVVPRLKGMERSLRGAYYGGASQSQLAQELTSLRQARIRAREDLIKAEKELTDLLTSRQEVLLVISGILD